MKEFETSPDLKQFLRFESHIQTQTVLEESERKIRKRLTKMPTTMSQAVLEGAYLLQAFVAALEALQITSLIYQPWGVYSFMYSPLSSTPLPTLTNPFRVKSVAPILAFLLLFTILVQIKLSSPSRKQTLRFELIKSIIVTALWVWLLISTIVDPNNRRYYPWPYALGNLIISFLFISYVYPRDV
jgi:hypothetical protein